MKTKNQETKALRALTMKLYFKGKEQRLQAPMQLPVRDPRKIRRCPKGLLLHARHSSKEQSPLLAQAGVPYLYVP